MRPLRTVHRLLEECGGLAMLKDPHMTTATAEIVAGERPRHEVQRDIKAKERARAQLARKWVPHLPFSIEDAIARATQVQTPPPPPLPPSPLSVSLYPMVIPVGNGQPLNKFHGSYAHLFTPSDTRILYASTTLSSRSKRLFGRSCTWLWC